MAMPEEGIELRGGAYNVAGFEVSAGMKDAPGLKCAGSVPSTGSDVRLPSVGFRCCHPGKLP
jgi:hypothetical protein